MFHFFHRTPEINLDCFTTDGTSYLTTPIVKASKTFPDWWMNLKPFEPKLLYSEEKSYHVSDDMTIRDCYAFIELYKRGAMIENWTDITIMTEAGKYQYWYSHGEGPEEHSKEQLGTSFPNHHHLKLVSPWAFREKTGAQFLWLGAEWSLDRFEIKVLPGVINFDIVSRINVNFMFPMRDDKFTIPVGNPLVHIVPLSGDHLKVTNHLVTEQEYNKYILNSKKVSFYGWKRALQLRKRNRKRGTCPFHGDNNG